MFEQATLSHGSTSNRALTTFAGVTGQALVVTALILGPMLFPQAIPKLPLSVPTVFLSRRASVPPATEAAPRLAAVRPRVLSPFNPATLFAPARVPDKTAFIDDRSAALPAVGYSGFAAGAGGTPDGVFGALPTAGVPAPPPPVPVARPVPVAAGPIAPARVMQTGGLVRPAQLIHRVEPVYPALAKQMRISGDVELEGIIAVDGHMIELKVISGHPLLVKAAYEAVVRWIYQPTTLNGKPVEVIAPIHVTFRLN